MPDPAKRARLATLKPRIATADTRRVGAAEIGDDPERARKRQIDRHRGSASARGYDRKWQRLRKAKLAADPLCECEDCDAGRLRVTAATVVDHIIPIEERPDLRLEWSNLRSMAKPCHDRRTAREQGFARRPN